MNDKNKAKKNVLQELNSPERLDDYINVSNPSIWLVVGVFAALMIGVIVWGAVGTLPKTLALKGLLLEGKQAVCYVDATLVKTDLVGNSGKITLPNGTGIDGIIESVGEIPFSKAEIGAGVQNDWIMENLVTANYSYEVVLTLSEKPVMDANTIVDVTLVTDEVKPIEFVLEKR